MMANIIAERYAFYECRQQQGESLSDYLENLRKKAKNCNFGDFLEDALRDRYVCGLSNGYMRQSLMGIKGLTLTTAVQISLSYEAGEGLKSNDNIPVVKNEPKNENFKVNTRNYTVNDKRQYTYFKPPCLPELERFKRAICNYCNTKGHIARSCVKRNKPKPAIKIGENAQNVNKTLSSEPCNSVLVEHTIYDDNVDESYTEQPESIFPDDKSNDRLNDVQASCQSNTNADVTTRPYDVNYAHKTSGRQPPYKIRLMLNKDIITFEIDTGSAITIISESTYDRCFSHMPLKSTSAIVKTYSKESLSILGKISVSVYCNGQEYQKLRVFVLRGNGANLLGRSWLNVMKLNWNLIINNSSADSDSERTKTRKPISQLLEQAKDCSITIEGGSRRAAISQLIEDNTDFSRAIVGEEYYEEKLDLKEKFAHVRSRTTAMEAALRVEIQRLREKRILPTPTPSERKGHTVVLRNPLL